MSEMIKNSDVEDVLFSIRRLVSDVPEDKPVEDTTEAPEEANSNGALFLTSSLRVNDPATEPEQVDLEDMTSGFSHFRDAVTRDAAVAEEFKSLEEAFSDISSDTLPEKSEDTSTDAPRRLHLSEVVSDATPPAEPNEYFEDEETGQLEMSEDLSARKWSTDPDVDTLSEFATPEDTFGAEAEIDAGLSQDVSEDEVVVEDVTENTTADQWIEDAAEELSEGGTDALDDAAFEEEAAPQEAHADDVEDETDVELGADQIEDADTSDVVADDAEDDQETIALAAGGLADFDENVLDEDALRDMVTEIVREELSGELGERITRNVRKLVRREIHRALMTREFD